MITVVVIEDDVLVGQGTVGLLERDPGIMVLGLATDVERALDLITRTAPSVALSDVIFGGEPAGFALAARVRSVSPSTAVLFLSAHGEAWFYARALESGAAGYLLKSASIVEVVSAIRTAAIGGSVFPVTAIQPSAEMPPPPSGRQLQVIELVVAGLSNGEIGMRLGISDKTVESYIARSFHMYGVQSRTELAMHTVRSGWIPHEGPRR